MSKISIKTKEDIQILREGGKRHAEIMRRLISETKAGVSSKYLDDFVRELIFEKGDKPSFLDYSPKGAERPYPASICVSVNDEIVHGIPNEKEKILKDGDLVSLDFGLTHKGLITDMAVTVSIGKVSEEVDKLIINTKKALMAGIKASKGGKRIGDISSAVQKVALANNYGVVKELAGHGVGYKVHEMPFVPNFGEPGRGELLRPGMVIAIEPMFNLGGADVIFDQEDGYTYRTMDGSVSAHFEHTILVTKGEAEILTA